MILHDSVVEDKSATAGQRSDRHTDGLYVFRHIVALLLPRTCDHIHFYFTPEKIHTACPIFPQIVPSRPHLPPHRGHSATLLLDYF